MDIKLLNEKEKEYAETLGKYLVKGKIRGSVNLIDELEKLKHRQ